MDLSWLPGRAESLNSGHVISLLAGVIIVWYVTSAIYVWYPLRHIPGPFLASFSHLWLATQHFRGEAYPALRGLAKYGSVVRIGPNRVLTDDPDALRRIAGLNSGYTRHRSYKDGTRFHREVDSMLGLLDEKAHSRIKAKTAAGYSGRDNPEFEKTVDREVERLLLLIRHKMLSTEQETRPVDFQALARFFALDALSSLAFGRPFGHLDNGEDLYGYVGAVARALRVLWLIRSLPVLRAMTFSDITFQYFGPKPTDKSGPGRLMGVNHDIIEARWNEPDAKGRNDMLGLFMRNGLSKEECEAETMTHIVAGSDTTAMYGVMLYIVSSPPVYRRLKGEIQKAINDGAVSQPITLQEAKQLPYLQAVVLEGFRMKNQQTYGHFKTAPASGDELDGVFIPPGTPIGHNSVALARKAAIFGSDPDTFRPERFLDIPEEKGAEMNRALSILFGGGRWQCAGKPLAFLMINKVVFELMRNFDFQFVHPEKTWGQKSNMAHLGDNGSFRVTEGPNI
ncbi:Cytochrome P450 monooxygenase lolP1 [Colletotrichum sp. SAR 10_77]|nr:Cytochrome P450 monooxygenase lolP1 [Colletotrichum sp. SAR 10_77]